MHLVASGSFHTAPVSRKHTSDHVWTSTGRSPRGHGRHTDDVGVAARSGAVVGAHPIIIVRASAQPAHIPADDAAQVDILISAQVSAKGNAGGHIQPVARRSDYTAPVSRKPSLSNVRSSFGRRHRRQN